MHLNSERTAQHSAIPKELNAGHSGEAAHPFSSSFRQGNPTPKQPLVYLGVELRDVRSPLREVEQLERSKG